MPTLYVVATPIGNLNDMTPRAIETLRTVGLIAAEDTRSLHKLLHRAGVQFRGTVVSHHEHNETESARGLIDAVRAGQSVVFVPEAGMPAISDPGYRLVQEAIAADIAVTVAPGASAAITALVLSGLPTDRFAFEGFLPRKAGEKATVLAALAAETRTLIFYESPHRTAETLTTMAQAFGAERAAAVARELCIATGQPVSVTAGIHVDNATAGEVKALHQECLDATEAALEMLLD